MSSIRYVSQHLATDVSDIRLTDIFTSDFNMYRLNITLDSSAGNGVYVQFINSSGSIISSSNYDYQVLQYRSDTTSFTDSGGSNQTAMTLLYQGTETSNAIIDVYNPTTSAFTYASVEQTGYYGGAGILGLGRIGGGFLKTNDVVNGIRIQFINATTPNYIKVVVYGIGT